MTLDPATWQSAAVSFIATNLPKWGIALLRVLVIIVVARLVLHFANLFIDRALSVRSVGNIHYIDERRARTVSTLLRSVLRYAVDAVAIFTVMTELGFDIAPLLAGAGVAGLAIGFGAQNLVRDVITGFFIILEDQYAVGDYISTNGSEGVVEEIGVRTTKLRAPSGHLHIIPNGTIQEVTNHSRGTTRAMVDVGIAYEEDVDQVMEILRRVARETAAAMPDKIRQGPDVLGVVNFGPSEVVLRLMAQAAPMQHWEVERELRRRIKEAFDREGVEIPYSRQVLVPPQVTKIARQLESGVGSDANRQGGGA